MSAFIYTQSSVCKNERKDRRLGSRAAWEGFSGFYLALGNNTLKKIQEVINELAGEPALEKFKAEFEKVHRALIDANQSNTKLAQKERFKLI